MDMITDIFLKAAEYDRGDAQRIQHFTKVHDYCRQIGIAEGLPEQELRVLELAAILHDIGIRKSMEIYGDGAGKHQEELGPAVARELLKDTPITEMEKERVCYLIAHHHTYDRIDGMDYRILVEADFLVNLHEGHRSREAIQNAYDRMFRTETGKTLCKAMFDSEGNEGAFL